MNGNYPPPVRCALCGWNVARWGATGMWTQSGPNAGSTPALSRLQVSKWVSKLPGRVPHRGSGTSADRASCLGFCDRLRCSAPPGSRLISVRSAVRIGPGPSVRSRSKHLACCGFLVPVWTALFSAHARARFSIRTLTLPAGRRSWTTSRSVRRRCREPTCP
jgi:hypothetical protein